MPPEGYTTTRSAIAWRTLTRVMTRHNCSSYAEVIKHPADTALIKITIQGLVHLLAERVYEVDNKILY